METSKWLLTDEEKLHFIDELTPQLQALRTKAGISQEELSALIGVSRQTYVAIEGESRKMSWRTYLALIMFYDYNQKTHQAIRALGAYPHEVIRRFNDSDAIFELDVASFLSGNAEGIMAALDDQALSSIRTMIMLEYARCTKMPGEAVVKSFDGVTFTNLPNPQAAEALRAIKGRKRRNGQR